MHHSKYSNLISGIFTYLYTVNTFLIYLFKARVRTLAHVSRKFQTQQLSTIRISSVYKWLHIQNKCVSIKSGQGNCYTLTCVQDAVRLLTMILGVTPLDNDPSPLSVVTSSLTNFRGSITLGEHDLLVVLTSSL